MLPTLNPRDYVLALRHCLTRAKAGQVALVQHRELGLIIKRVKVVAGGRALLEGDNAAESSPSEHIGWVDEGDLIPVIGQLRRP